MLCRAGEAVVEQWDYYMKQTYRNRCTVAGANGVLALSIPVEKTTAKTLMRDVRISEHGDWQQMHWRSIESAYNSSPFYEYYKDDFRPFFEKKWTFLCDLNAELQALVLELLDVHPRIGVSEAYCAEPAGSCLDLREQIHPKKMPVAATPPYYQVFDGKFGFQAGLSIIDLLFNMGNESVLVLSATR